MRVAKIQVDRLKECGLQIYEQMVHAEYMHGVLRLRVSVARPHAILLASRMGNNYAICSGLKKKPTVACS